MSTKLLTTTATATNVASSLTSSHSHSLTFLSLRFLQSQAPPPNPSFPPLPFLLPALHPIPLPNQQRKQYDHQHRRTLTTTPHPLKKSGGKQSSKRPPPNLPASKADVDIHDLSDYKDAITKAHESLRAEVGKVKPGGLGRDLEGLEGVRVQVVEKEKGGQGRAATLRLGELAQVVPRGGKSVVVLVNEKEHIKPIISALAQPPLNLNPQQTSPTEPQTLTIPLPPVTQESRQEAAKIVGQKGEAALFALREARGAQRKRLRALELGRMVGPDELRRAEREVDKVNEGAVAEAKKVVEEGKRRVMGQ